MIAEAYFSADGQIRSEHYHDCHQILLIEEGEIEGNLGKKKFVAKKGDLILFSRFENHSVASVSSEYCRFVLRLIPTDALNENRVYSILSNRPSGFSGILKTGEKMDDFLRIFSALTKEWYRKEELSEEMISCYVHELMIMIYRLIPQKYRFLENENFSLVYKIQKRFETDFKHSYSLTSLAKEYGMSPSALSHDFKRITGVSVMEYLLGCRLAAAKERLIQTGASIGKIVEECGFSDCSNFGRIFKKKNGLSPREFRREYKR